MTSSSTEASPRSAGRAEGVASSGEVRGGTIGTGPVSAKARVPAKAFASEGACPAMSTPHNRVDMAGTATSTPAACVQDTASMMRRSRSAPSSSTRSAC